MADTTVQRARRTLETVADHRAERLLDLGCGDGSLTPSLAAACGAERVVGVDVSAENVAATRRRGVEAVRATLEPPSLPFPNGSFDLVHVGEVLDYLDRVSDALAEIRRVMRPDGVLVLSTPNLVSIYNRLVVLFGRPPLPMRADNDSETDRDSLVPGARRTLFTAGTLRETLEECGFTVESITGGHASHGNVPFYVALVDRAVARVPQLSYRLVAVARA